MWDELFFLCKIAALAGVLGMMLGGWLVYCFVRKRLDYLARQLDARMQINAMLRRNCDHYVESIKRLNSAVRRLGEAEVEAYHWKCEAAREKSLRQMVAQRTAGKPKAAPVTLNGVWRRL